MRVEESHLYGWRAAFHAQVHGDLSEVTTLDLSNQGIQNSDMAELVAMIDRLTNLDSRDLSCNDIAGSVNTNNLIQTIKRLRRLTRCINYW